MSTSWPHLSNKGQQRMEMQQARPLFPSSPSMSPQGNRMGAPQVGFRVRTSPPCQWKVTVFISHSLHSLVKEDLLKICLLSVLLDKWCHSDLECHTGLFYSQTPCHQVHSLVQSTWFLFMYYGFPVGGLQSFPPVNIAPDINTDLAPPMTKRVRSEADDLVLEQEFIAKHPVRMSHLFSLCMWCVHERVKPLSPRLCYQ